MTSDLMEKLNRINARMVELVELTRKALRGEGSFGAEEIRSIREPLDEMEPILADSANLRKTHPEVAGQIEVYKSQLLELQKTSEQLRVSLIVQRASLETARVQVDSASQWCAAYRQTR